MKRSRSFSVVAALVLLAAISPTASAGVVFTATTKAESKTVRLAALTDSTVRGWVDGDLGRIEFLESGNGAWPKGGFLLTGDGGRTARFFDPAARKCRSWVPFFSARSSPPGPAREPGPFENFRAKKTLDEAGPAIAGVATRHYRFVIAYDTSVSGAAAARRLHTERTDDIWAAPGLQDPALAIWLTARARRTGNDKLDGKLDEATAEVRGAALKRVTVVKVELEGRPPQTTTTTVEVTQLTREEVPASMFLDPFPCKILTPEDRR